MTSSTQRRPNADAEAAGRARKEVSCQPIDHEGSERRAPQLRLFEVPDVAPELLERRARQPVAERKIGAQLVGAGAGCQDTSGCSWDTNLAKGSAGLRGA